MNNEVIDLEDEVWLDIEGYEGLYQVSNKGRVKSLGNNKTRKDKILKPRTSSKHGHQHIVLCKDGFKTNKWVHRLVAQAFLPRIKKEANCVDHIDTDPKNNCVENLRWCTQKENCNNELSKLHYRDAQRNIMTPVYCYETDKVYESASEVARSLNVKPGNVSKCCKGLCKHTGGYHFCYSDELSDTYELF